MKRRFSRSVARLAVDAVLQDAQNPLNGMVRLPTIFAIFSLISTTLFLVLAIWAAVDGAAPWVIGVFGIFIFIGIVLLMIYFHVRIYYDEQGFTVSNFWGAKRSYRYEEITQAVMTHGTGILYIGKKKVNVELLLRSGQNFYSYAHMRCRELRQGENIPLAPRPTNDIFKGNSTDGGVSFIIGYVLGLLLVAGMTAFCIWAYRSTHLLPWMIGMIVVLLADAIYLAYGILAVIVGRNPQKFNPKLLRLLFSKEYIQR